MKFRDILTEKFYKSFEYRERYFEVFINPTKKEIKELVKANSIKTVRLGITDTSRPVIYAWDGDLTHLDAEDKLKVNFDFGFWYSELKGKEIDSDWGSFDFNDFKYGVAMKKVIKKLFPFIVKKYHGWD